MLALKIFKGSPDPDCDVRYQGLVSSACKNFRGQRPLGAEIQSSEKSPVGCVNMRVYNFVVNGPNFFHR